MPSTIITTSLEAAVLARMSNTVLTKVWGDGDYTQFSKLRKEVLQNLSVVPSPYGAANGGHLGLGMFDVKYTLCTGQTYNVPLDLGVYDITIGASVSPVTRARREAEHHEAQRAFKTNTAVESILKTSSTKPCHPS